MAKLETVPARIPKDLHKKIKDLEYATDGEISLGAGIDRVMRAGAKEINLDALIAEALEKKGLTKINSQVTK